MKETLMHLVQISLLGSGCLLWLALQPAVLFPWHWEFWFSRTPLPLSSTQQWLIAGVM
jgi:hypothetical protein